MKRPEGFDSPPADGRDNDGLSSGSTKRNSPKRGSAKARKAGKAGKPKPSGNGLQSAPTKPKVTSPRRHMPREVPALLAQNPSQGQPVIEARSPRARLRRSARDRRRFERSEVRRFTRRSRHRRLGWVVALSVLALVAGLLSVAVYSPLLALRTVTIEGNSKVSADDVRGAIEDQMGTPLALLNYDALKYKLEAYPLIRSFSTEVVPPSTLKIHIVERAPMGVVSSQAGFQIIDPAGVVLESVLRRPEGIPLIDLGGQGTDSVAFSSVVDVMLALPETIRIRVDIIRASSKDDVQLVLLGAGQRVKWGSSERSALKARVLEELMATQKPDAHVEFDVSAPLSPVVRAG